jgi:primosomal protein N' (replication factor Y)
MATLPMPSSQEVMNWEISDAWERYSHGSTFISNISQGVAARAALTTAPGHDALTFAVDAALTALRNNRTSIIVVPDGKDVRRLHTLLLRYLHPDSISVVVAEASASARYKEFLRGLRGEPQLVIGTRNSIFTPVSNVGFIAVVDDGEDALTEIRTPSWNARDVAVMRSVQESTSLLIVSTGRTCETQSLVESGVLIDLEANREFVRSQSPKMRATSDDDLATDPLARNAIREGLRKGPVLIHVPRRGYQLNLRCNRCRESVRCTQCQGPMGRNSVNGPMNCFRCGAVSAAFACPWCQSTEVRTSTVGAVRTAEELGRAFPDIPIRTSGKDNILEMIDAEPALVIATPGAAPRIKDGYYQAAVILDADATLTRSFLRSHEEAMLKWSEVASLVQPISGRIVIAGDDSHHVIQAMLKRDPIGFARRELEIRASASMPPATTLAEIMCTRGLWSQLSSEFGSQFKVLGPVPAGENERVLVAVHPDRAGELAVSLRAMVIRHNLSKVKGEVEVKVNPSHLS